MDSAETLREATRNRLRTSSLLVIRKSGVGRVASRVTVQLPRRTPQDAPSAIHLKPFRGHRLAILAHYDAAGVVDEAFRDLARAFYMEGYEVVVSSTAPMRLETLVPYVEEFAVAAIVRGNEGFDFQSWRRGVELARASRWDFNRLILTNGSMYGPLFPFGDILSKMDKHPSWGMTESLDITRHVQSWWLAFGDAVLSHPEFDRYWSRVRPARNKWGTILAHELRWSTDLALAGPTAAFVSVEDHGSQRNPLFFAWKELIRDFGVPFFKRSLLGPNYDRIDMTGWRDFVVDQAPRFNLDAIEQ